MTEMTTDTLTLDANHCYWWNGRKVRGVTAILTAVGATDHDKPWFTEQARDWGSVLDQCCSLIDMGTLDLDSVDERIRPEVDAYAAWRAMIGGRVIASQLQMYSPTYGVAGTLDVLFKLDSGRYPLVDRKRGKADKAAKLQTALYAVLAAETLGIPLALIDRYALDGFSSGPPTVQPFRDRSDIAAVLGAAALVTWADNAGLRLSGDKT